MIFSPFAPILIKCLMKKLSLKLNEFFIVRKMVPGMLSKKMLWLKLKAYFL